MPFLEDDLMASPAPGLQEAGNINLGNRPRVTNADGTVSTIRSMSVGIDGSEVLIPTVSDDGRVLSEADAISLYRKTGKHLGKFDAPSNATAFAERLHKSQEQMLAGSIDLSRRIDAPEGFAVTPKEVTVGASDLVDDDWKSATWAAAFRRNNELAALASSEAYWQSNEPEAGFNPWDKVKGTPDEANFRQLSEARNQRKFDAIKADIVRETEDRKRLDSLPWWTGLLTEGTAGILSPTTLIPGGYFVKGARGGVAIVKAGASVGVSNAFATSVQEGELHGIEQTRTAGESGMAVGASLFLGGILGAGGQALLSRAEWQRGVAGLDHDIAGVRLSADARPVFDDVYSQLKASGMADEQARVNASVFAARYATRAQRLGEGATALDVYKADGLQVRKVDEVPPDLAASLGVSPADVLERTFQQSDVTSAIRAYHGSPHAFDKFDLTKIGSGEGGQAYGHGLYFAEKEEVARSYRDNLAPMGVEVFQGGKSVGMLPTSHIVNDPSYVAAYNKLIPADVPGWIKSAVMKDIRDVGDAGGKVDVAAAMEKTIARVINDLPAGAQSRAAASASDAIRKAYASIGNDVEFRKPGRVYEVDIKAHPDHFLDWDKPLSDQSQFVKDALARLDSSISTTAPKITDIKDAEIRSIVRRALKENDGVVRDLELVFDNNRDLYEAVVQHAERNGVDLGAQDMRASDYVYKQAQGYLDALSNSQSTSGDALGRLLGVKGPDAMAAGTASAKVRAAGIPGIKYLDAGSRAGEAETRNFVVFDDNLVDIVRQYQREGVDARGRITVFKDNSAVIDLFKGADESTFIHEAGHLWLGEMVRDAGKSAGIKLDLDATLKWFGIDDAGKITLKHHEQWARGFEEYLREGKAPSMGLAKAFEQFKEWLTTIYRSIVQLGPDHVKITDEVRGVMDRLLATDAEIARGGDVGSGSLKSVGAAANTATDIADNTIAGRAARGVAAATAQMNPLLRALHSPSAAYREVATNLVENPLYLKKNFEGVASQPAVETLMKEYNGGLAKALQATNDAYPEYRKAGGALGKDGFREAVGKAMRRGDADTDPIIAKVAQEYRARVFDPLKEQAIKAGLLPADVSVDTAQSYFTRMWNGRKISADEQGFKGMVQDWVELNAPKWADQFDRSAERRLEPLRREIADLEMAKLRRGEELKQRATEGEISAGGHGEMTEDDIRQALRIVAGGAPKPKGVKTLSQFVVEQGGLVDDAGELAHRGITNKARPGMVRKERRTAMSDKGGWTLDDMARHSWENGYFPEHSNRPSPDEFVEALNDDFSKIRAVVKAEDKDAFRLTDLVAQLEADLSRAGVKADGKPPRFSTSEEMKGAVERVFKALDAEADRKATLLREKLTEREADIRVDRESRFVGDPKELGKSIADEVFDTLTGRAGDGGFRNDALVIKSRGPLKERTFNIEDLFRSSNGRGVEDYLEHDVEQVARRYTRVMGADVELARKFGSVDMVDQIAKIRDDYRNIRADITDEKQLTKLAAREKADVGDLQALRDMLRGTNPADVTGTGESYSRFVRSVNHLNYLRSMGEVAIASLSETVRPAMVHGLMPYMETLGQTLTNLKGIRASVQEAQLAGVVTERVLGTRLATLSEIIDPHASRGPVEAFLENMTNFASRWNGIRLLTDMQKSIAAVMTQNRLLRGSEMFSEVAGKERAYLAYLGIDQGMAERIAKQFAEHGETIDKVRVANQEQWTDEVAARTYRAAISKDVDSIITTKGVADTPLFANTPTGRAMLQFKSFALASHQRVLLRGLQEDQARFMGGLVAMTTIGMMATWLKAVSGNRAEKLQDIGQQPGWWISEGLDRAGIFAVPMELANTFEKATGFNPIKSPIKAFDQKAALSQRNQNRSLMGSIAGPSAGLVDDASQVMGLPKKLIDGEEITQAQKNAAERLLPFNSYLGVRQMMRYVVNPQANQ